MLLRKLRYRVILQYLKYTIFRKLIVPYEIFKILLLIAVVPSFLCTFRIAHRILGTKKPARGGFKLCGEVTTLNILTYFLRTALIIFYFFSSQSSISSLTPSTDKHPSINPSAICISIRIAFSLFFLVLAICLFDIRNK